MTQRSAARRACSAVRRRYDEGRHDLPDGAFRAWQIHTAAGAVALVFAMAVLVWTGKYLTEAGRLTWEPALLRSIGQNGPFRFSDAVWFQTFGTDITLAILILLTAGIASWARRPIAAWSIILAFLVTDPVVRFGWLLWDRARPDLLYNGVASPGFHSFPSGHTAKTLAVYGILTALWIRESRNSLEKIAALVILAAIAVVVPLGRLAMGVHWPTDILAGWILGALWLAVLVSGLRYERL